MTPICIDCCCAMRCEKNGQLVNDVEAGGFPSTYWHCDVWECPICHKQIATGLSEYFEIQEENVPESVRGQSITFAHNPSQKHEFADQFADGLIRVDCFEGVQLNPEKANKPGESVRCPKCGHLWRVPLAKNLEAAIYKATGEEVPL